MRPVQDDQDTAVTGLSAPVDDSGRAMAGPTMYDVTSSNLQAVGYDAGAQELHVRFRGGGLYVYSGVPEDVYQTLRTGPGAGSFFSREVKNSYPWVKRG